MPQKLRCELDCNNNPCCSLCAGSGWFLELGDGDFQPGIPGEPFELDPVDTSRKNIPRQSPPITDVRASRITPKQLAQNRVSGPKLKGKKDLPARISRVASPVREPKTQREQAAPVRIPSGEKVTCPICKPARTFFETHIWAHLRKDHFGKKVSREFFNTHKHLPDCRRAEGLLVVDQMQAERIKKPRPIKEYPFRSSYEDPDGPGWYYPESGYSEDPAERIRYVQGGRVNRR